MITNLKRTIIYICPVCGKLKKFNINIFDFSGGGTLYLKCGCGNSFIKITAGKNKNYVISAPCAVCSEEHMFEIGAKVFWNAPQIVFGCPNMEFDILYGGNKTEMDVLCDEISKNKPVIAGEYFFENLFLSDVLKEVDLCIKKKKAKCSCGGNKIIKNLYIDRIELVCENCGSKKIIDAVCENDVKNVAKAAKGSGIVIKGDAEKKIH